MSGGKLKQWKTSIEQRLERLESLFRNRKSKPDNRENIAGAVEQESPEQRQKPLAESLLLGTIKWLGKLLTVAVLTLGVVTGYLALVPRITIIETEPLNPPDPFSARFLVSNDGPLGINSFEASCFIVKVVDRNENSIMNGVIENRTATKPRMEVGERATLQCPFARLIQTNSPIAEADIEFSVHFRPDFTWWHVTRIHRFKCVPDSTGLLHWSPLPVDSK